MISAIDNNKNQYFEKVGAVNFQASRGCPPEFIQDLQRKTNEQDKFQRQDDQRVDKVFGSLLTYGKSNVKSPNPFAQTDSNEYNLLHPDVKDEHRANKFDFVA